MSESSGVQPEPDERGLLALTRTLERFTTRVQYVLAGTWSGRLAYVFEYEYEVPGGVDNPDVRHRRTCVAVRIAEGIGPLAVVPRTFLASIGAKVSMSELRTGDSPFDKRLIVSAPGREHLTGVLTTRVRTWLMQNVHGSEVLMGYGHILWMARRRELTAIELLRLGSTLAGLLQDEAQPLPPAVTVISMALTAERVEQWDQERRASRDADLVRSVTTTVLVVIGILILLPLAAGLVFAISCASSGRCI